MNEFLHRISRIVWGDGLLLLLLGTGLLYLVCGGWRPFSRIHRIFSAGGSGKSPLTPFQACTTSLAAAMGTGNIVGVATALTLGGAGAVFWMWVAAFLGMLLIYAENILGALYRSEDPDGHPVMGAMAYLRDGLRSPKLAWLFALFCTAASFGMGNMTQSNAMAQTLEAAFSIPPLLTGIPAALLTAAVILGGAKRIGRVTQCLIPLISVLYLAAAGYIIWKFRSALPGAFSSIFQEAFGLSAVGGGISGAAVSRALSVGIRRGVFSNEAGLGSSSILHSEAVGDDPELPGLWGMAEVFADTFVCCTATALVILCSGAMDSGTDGGALVLEAFRLGMGDFGTVLLPPIIALFALCTLIGWSYCGSSAFGYLTGGRYINAFRAVFCLAAALGAVLRLDTVWTLADIANGCMVYCNLPALVLLLPEVRRKSRSAA